MKYSTSAFDEVLEAISEEIKTLESDMCIYDFEDNEITNTYNRLTTILLMLKEIKRRQ